MVLKIEYVIIYDWVLSDFVGSEVLLISKMLFNEKNYKRLVDHMLGNTLYDSKPHITETIWE